MKATLSFYLPEEREEHAAAVRAMDYKIAIEQISAFVRLKLKYGTDLSADEEDAFIEVREKILEVCSDLEVEI